MKLLSFLKPAPHIDRVSPDKVDATYKKFRRQNFIAIFIGYAGYYLLRTNFSLAMPYLSNMGANKGKLGLILSAFSIAYGISKFIMGNVSDRSNPRYFLAIGLIVSIIANVTLGWVAGAASSLVAIMFFLMLINGWAQGMGAPPCYRTAAHWFSISERGRKMAVWNVAHNLGAAALGGLAMVFIPILTWKSIFFLPSIIVLAIVIIVLFIMRDTPQSVGLMPIEEYSNEYPAVRDDEKKDCIEDRERELTAKEILFKYVLNNKYVWFLACANIFVYFIRYGISGWSPTYLTEMKGLHIDKGGIAFIIYESAGVLGMLGCGYMSDKFFKGRRAPVSILCMLIVSIGILVYWTSTSIMVTYTALLIIGMFIYGPVMLVGVQLIDIMPKKAVGTSIGLLGLFAYLFGTTIASAGFGYIVEYFGWNGGFITMLASCVLAIVFFSLTLKIKGVVQHTPPKVCSTDKK